MTINSKLGELIHIREDLQAKNARHEEYLSQNSEKKREQVLDRIAIIDEIVHYLFTNHLQ